MTIGPDAALPGRPLFLTARSVAESGSRPGPGADAGPANRAGAHPARVRWAIVGAGGAAAAFALDLARSRTGQVHRVAARDTARGAAFAARLGPEIRSGSLAEALADPAVDAVYIATPTSSHLSLTLAAIEAGKPVLVEKPLAMDAAGAEAIARAAEAHRVLAMEAMWMCLTPGIVRLKQLVGSGAIGAIVEVTANLSFAAPRRGPGRDPSLDDALLDLGVYPIWLALHLLGEPDQVRAALVRGSDHGPVAGTVSLGYAGATASLSFGTQAEGGNEARIVGRRGVISVSRQFICPPMLRLRRTREAGGAPPEAPARPRRLKAVRDALSGLRDRPIPTLYSGSGLHYQADHFAALLAAGRTDSPILPLATSVAVARVIEAARK